MAFATVHFTGPGGSAKDAPVGFSWTTFFFGLFPALIRGDFKWGLIMFAAGFITFGISWLVFPFIYNRLYIQSLLQQGYKVKSYTGNKAMIELKAQIKLKK